jgi:predicted lipoprotein with Yx(FWY)xxD motif
MLCIHRKLTISTSLIALCAALSPVLGHAGAEAPLMPRQVQLQTVKDLGDAKVFADTAGKTLYFFDNDLSFDGVEAHFQSTCVDECRQAWPPLIAPAGATPIGDWALTERPEDENEKQWTYKGRLVYTFTADPGPGVAKGDGMRGGWHAVRYEVPPNIKLAGGITIQKSKSGWVLANARGMSLYKQPAALKTCDAQCLIAWRPVPAAAIARPIGEWTIVSQSDGTRQWAYRGNLVFTSQADQMTGDTRGDGKEGWSVVKAEEQPALAAK